MKAWATGVVATVLAGVVIYWLTTGIDRRVVTPPESGTASPLEVAITSPREGAHVDTYQRVSGSVSDSHARVWVVVHPLETPDCWVQTQAVVAPDGNWNASVQFGEAIAAHRGKPFEVRALANPRARLSPGMVRCWPEAAAVSEPVRIKRQ